MGHSARKVLGHGETSGTAIKHHQQIAIGSGPRNREHDGAIMASQPYRCARGTKHRRDQHLGTHPPLTQTRRIPPAGKSHLGLAGRWLRWGRVGVGVGQDCTELGVELGEPRVLVPQLLHPLLVRDLPLLVFFPELLVFSLEKLVFALQLLHSLLELDLPPLELDLSQLVIDNGSPIQHRQKAPEPRQGGVVLRFAD